MSDLTEKELLAEMRVVFNDGLIFPAVYTQLRKIVEEYFHNLEPHPIEREGPLSQYKTKADTEPVQVDELINETLGWESWCEGGHVTRDEIKQLLTQKRTVTGDFPTIVCLCGSTRFMEAFFDEGWRETLGGKIVLSVGVCKHTDHHGAEALGEDVVKALDELHFRKIDLADEVLILNVGGYIGESTRNELEYAKRKGKKIRFLEEHDIEVV